MRRRKACAPFSTSKTISCAEVDMAVDPPPLPGAIVHDEIVAARAPWIHRVDRGQTLRIVDLEGNQAVDFLIYNALDDAERYSAQDTIAGQGNIFLREGSVLRSN